VREQSKLGAKTKQRLNRGIFISWVENNANIFRSKRMMCGQIEKQPV